MPDHLDLIRSLIAPDMDALDQLIRNRMLSDVALVRSIADYIIGSGGKRLRPSLVLLSAGACGYSGPHRLELAAVVEFIHTATLLHDDVIDESELRRGRGTANSRFGNAASVLVGDFLYSRAFQMMLVARSMRVMEVLADATNAIAEGEVLQLMNIHNLKMTETEYLGVIRRKTAKLFQAATQLGAILGSAPSERERELAEYGMHLGTAFQLIDDVLDYSGDAASVGKTVGVDLVEGKVTLPLIFILREGDADQICQIQSAMRVGGRGDFSGVRMLLETSGALEYARHVARKEAALARDAISSLPNSEYKESLLELAAFSVERNH